MSRSQPLIAAAIIVKNEAEHLQRCLNSIKDFCDEIIVVDTGSTDNTVDIATAFATKVLHKEWKQDFAASRNFALDAVTAEWVLYIDADEELVMDDVAALRQQVVNAQDVMAFGLRMHTQVNWTPYIDYRMWRNRDDIRFIGEIHETTMDGIMRVGLETNRTLEPIDISIMHHGYEGDLTAKHQRNLPLLQAELKLHPEKINLWNHLGRVHLALGRPDLAEQTWRTGINRIEQFGIRSAYDVQIYASLADMLIGFGRDGTPLIERGLQLDPNFLTFQWLLARQFAVTGRFPEAIYKCDELIGMAQVPLSKDAGAYNLDMFSEWPRNLKIDCLFNSMRLAEAHAMLLAENQEFAPHTHRWKQLEVCEAFAEYEPNPISPIVTNERILLDDVSFIIPVRVDTADRLANVKALCRQLVTTYSAKIVIGCEAPDSLQALLPAEVEIIHIDGNPDHPFHMTRVVNEIARQVTTPIRVHLDTDSLLPPAQLLEAVRILRAKEADMVFPFSFAIGVPQIERNKFSAGYLQLDLVDTPRLMVGVPTGLCQVWDAESFTRAGTENEFMIGWAPEDTERVIRLKKLGMRTQRVNGPIFHMDHETVAGRDVRSEFHEVSQTEMERIEAMTTEELVADIASWPWLSRDVFVTPNPFEAKDMTVLIPVRIDSSDRLRNLVTCTNALLSTMTASVVVGIGDPEVVREHLDPRVHVMKVYDPANQPFHRTRINNDLARAATTDYIAIVDTDVVVPQSQWKVAIESLRSGNADLVYPFDGRMVEVSYGCHSWLERGDFDSLPIDSQKIIEALSVGGCFTFSRSAFMSFGMENENFRSWGFEDDERVLRAHRMGMRVQRLPGVIYHVFHERGPDSRPDNPYIQSNAQEVQRIKHLKIAELRAQVKSWSWVQERTPVKVLLWNDTWEADDQLFDLSDGSVEIVHDRSQIDKCEVVVFCPATLDIAGGLELDLPKTRSNTDQLWVLLSREAVSHFPSKLDADYCSHFDVVAGYQRGSNIWVPYVFPGLLQRLPEIVPVVERHAELASAWISSDWDAWGRVQFLSDVMLHMEVHSYGRKLKNVGHAIISNHHVRHQISSRYRFVMAFENARDVDYVTEKFFEPLMYGAVPVYFGAPNIEDFAPGDHCYIDASQFASAKELADFLTSMTDDDYMRYHEWRTRPLRESFVAMCNLRPVPMLSQVVQTVREKKSLARG
jgi:cellulose synthase/poly-beta-1,6-N-acetylglucosamine synthase-like glycosyltransferase